MRLLGSFLQTAYGLSVVGDSGGESESACAAWSFYLINMSSRQSDRRAKGRGEAAERTAAHTGASTAAGSGKATGLKLISIWGLVGFDGCSLEISANPLPKWGDTQPFRCTAVTQWLQAARVSSVTVLLPQDNPHPKYFSSPKDTLGGLCSFKSSPDTFSVQPLFN